MATTTETKPEKQKQKALVCAKCGVLAPASDEFRVGFIAAYHVSGGRSSRIHKLSIQLVNSDTQIKEQLGWLIAGIVYKEIYKEEP